MLYTSNVTTRGNQKRFSVALGIAKKTLWQNYSSTQDAIEGKKILLQLGMVGGQYSCWWEASLHSKSSDSLNG